MEDSTVSMNKTSNTKKGRKDEKRKKKKNIEI